MTLAVAVAVDVTLRRALLAAGATQVKGVNQWSLRHPPPQENVRHPHQHMVVPTRAMLTACVRMSPSERLPACARTSLG